MEAILQQIRDFADAAHGEQMRKYTPERYIVHPVRVMEICRKHNADLPMMAAALLHDVLEDTPVTRDEMHAFLLEHMTREQADRTLELVVELTDVFVKDAYPEWNRRQRKDKELERMLHTSPDSQTIKYADIMDNCREIVKNDRHFARIFLRECHRLLKQMTKGNRDLYNESLEVVENAIGQLNVSNL